MITDVIVDNIQTIMLDREHNFCFNEYTLKK